MRTDSPMHRLIRSRAFRLGAWVVGVMLAVSVTVGSAILAKENAAPPLVVLDAPSAPDVRTAGVNVTPAIIPAKFDQPKTTHALGETELLTKALNESSRRFNGRPIVPARVVWMQVTAYSPGAESCAPFADGKTATLHSVWTNAMHLVAADTRILPFGSLVSVPGYDDAQVVPVLDRGAAIKGYELDVLFPTARQARAWGVRRLPIVIWEYADGKPADDPRTFR